MVCLVKQKRQSPGIFNLFPLICADSITLIKVCKDFEKDIRIFFPLTILRFGTWTLGTWVLGHINTWALGIWSLGYLGTCALCHLRTLVLGNLGLGHLGTMALGYLGTCVIGYQLNDVSSGWLNFKPAGFLFRNESQVVDQDTTTLQSYWSHLAVIQDGSNSWTLKVKGQQKMYVT